MSRKFLTPLDLAKNELQNARIQNLATAPSSPVVGQVYYDTTLNGLYIYNGTAWALAGGITAGTLAARPAASSVASGTFYYATDNYLIYYSNGTSWQQTQAFGSGASTTVNAGGTGGDGTSTSYARADHAHTGPTLGTVTATTSYGLSSNNGVSTSVSRADHSHGTPSLTSNAASNITATSAAAGSGTAPAKDDHVHGFTPGNFALSAFGVPTGNVSLNSNKITNLADPTSAQDAATKNYVDATAQGLNVHDNAQAATTANLSATYAAGTSGADGGTGVGATLTNAGSFAALVIDGVTLSVGERVLVKNQTSQTTNGIYTVTNTGSGASAWVLTRATDGDNSVAGEMVAGDFIFVAAGTTNGSTGWVETNQGTSTTPPKGIKIGTDNIAYSQFSGAGTYTASNGVTLTGNNFTFTPLSTGGLQTGSSGASVKLPTNSGLNTDSTGTYVGAGTGISVSGSNVAIDTSVVARKYSANVGDGTSTSITVTHNLGTRDVHVTLYDASSYAVVMCDVTNATTNTITLGFSTAPTNNQYRVVVIG